MIKSWTGKILITIVSIPVLGLIALFSISDANPLWLRNPWRKTWKEKAVAEIKKLSNDPAWLRMEADQMKAKAEAPRIASDPWLSHRLILMKNGEWIVYSNICRKQDCKISDLFLGRASDGKWYYSTYHFCINMYCLSAMTDRSENWQPESVAEFVHDFFLQPFDGISDNCFGKTWPQNHK